ncbi:MAG: hypothetical protein EPO23_09365 [Xanthobacteraceae bacterium]|nr:MAG: hypothetical protein EPO23_09365 [Xanthobacteraceae bacterium]
MALVGTATSSTPAAARTRLWSAPLVALWRGIVRDLSYRPELHYMRGPGPAWRAKHGIPERR